MVRALINSLLTSACLGFLALTMLAKSCVSEVQVARVTSPDNLVDAVVVETNGGATTSFGYNVYLVPRRIGLWYGTHVAFLYGSTSATGEGVDLHWLGPNKLALEYLHARRESLTVGTVDMCGQQFEIMLRPRTINFKAPGASMEHNLNPQTQRKVVPNFLCK